MKTKTFTGDKGLANRNDFNNIITSVGIICPELLKYHFKKTGTMKLEDGIYIRETIDGDIKVHLPNGNSINVLKNHSNGSRCNWKYICKQVREIICGHYNVPVPDDFPTFNDWCEDLYENGFCNSEKRLALLAADLKDEANYLLDCIVEKVAEMNDAEGFTEAFADEYDWYKEYGDVDWTAVSSIVDDYTDKNEDCDYDEIASIAYNLLMEMFADRLKQYRMDDVSEERLGETMAVLFEEDMRNMAEVITESEVEIAIDEEMEDVIVGNIFDEEEENEEDVARNLAKYIMRNWDGWTEEMIDTYLAEHASSLADYLPFGERTDTIGVDYDGTVWANTEWLCEENFPELYAKYYEAA